MFELIFLLLAAQPDAGNPAGAVIRVTALSEPEELEQAPELRIDGKSQAWTESSGRTWVYRTRMAGMHTFELRAPVAAEDDGALHRFAAPVGDAVTIQLEGWFPSGTGPAGPRCLYVDAPDAESSKWTLCDADPGLPMRKVIDLSAANTCPRPAMSTPAFMLTHEGAGLADRSSAVFFDTLPGLYRARILHGRLELKFVPGAEACRALAKGEPWLNLHRWRYSGDGGRPR